MATQTPGETTRAITDPVNVDVTISAANTQGSADSAPQARPRVRSDMDEVLGLNRRFEQ